MEVTNISDYATLQAWLNEYCERQKYPGWHNYGPADIDKYEQDEVKMMILNSESGGFKQCPKVPPDEYIGWIRDRHATPRYSALFVSLIREYISQRKNGKAISEFDYNTVSSLYQNDDVLLEAMVKTIYMNSRITSNDDTFPREEKGVVLNEAHEFSEYRKKFIQILRPQIIICSGDSALAAIFNDSRVFTNNTFVENDVFVRDNCVLVAIPHLSRPANFGGYENMHRLAVKCSEVYCQIHG